WAKEEERTLTEKDIKQLNEILLVRPCWKDAITPNGQSTRRLIKVGDYKEFPNSVRLSNGELFEYASPMDTPILMGELIQWFREESSKKELHPVVLAALFHYKFVRIHPFDDGNGRISRLLMNYVLFKNDLPPIVIKSEEPEKRKYLLALNKADTGDLDSFVQFIAQQQISSLELAIKAAKGESLDEPGDLDKKIKVLKQKLNSEEDEIKILKNKESVFEVFTNVIEPLIYKLIEKLNQFDDLFKTKNVEIRINGSDIIYDQLEEKINSTKAIMLESVVSQLYFSYELKYFRKRKSGFSVDIRFLTHFQDHIFIINSPEINYSIEKLYHQNLSEVEVEDLIEKMGTGLLNKIEAKLDEF
ncbi:MAG: Fic family protein, partial [Cytophagales bacterium]|nr:Fic family protein [Cytophagales bacterium]